MRISDWSSDVCSSDLRPHQSAQRLPLPVPAPCPILQACEHQPFHSPSGVSGSPSITRGGAPASTRVIGTPRPLVATVATGAPLSTATKGRSEEHTSELQSLMRISYAVFCLKKKNT